MALRCNPGSTFQWLTALRKWFDYGNVGGGGDGSNGAGGDSDSVVEFSCTL